MCIAEKRVIENEFADLYHDQGYVIVPYFEPGYSMALLLIPEEY